MRLFGLLSSFSNVYNGKIFTLERDSNLGCHRITLTQKHHHGPYILRLQPAANLINGSAIVNYDALHYGYLDIYEIPHWYEVSFVSYSYHFSVTFIFYQPQMAHLYLTNFRYHLILFLRYLVVNLLIAFTT